ncbi:hypothetical protein EV421DRAFT_509480 [Armillaria borealis]|uniref:Uncharacterized protein n=1 Tax=Armillaria borealis TaxID=47425 RepID=A0AA39JJ63_9AGAR|nr:hypothetical protein EV421DRAFT_509480 [Armillaria borealis]
MFRRRPREGKEKWPVYNCVGLSSLLIFGKMAKRLVKSRTFMTVLTCLSSHFMLTESTRALYLCSKSVCTSWFEGWRATREIVLDTRTEKCWITSSSPLRVEIGVTGWGLKPSEASVLMVGRRVGYLPEKGNLDSFELNDPKQYSNWYLHVKGMNNAKYA